METIELYNQLIMYLKIHELKELGLSMRKTADQLNINFRTVKKYLKMSLSEFEAFLQKKRERQRLLAPYEDYVVECLSRFSETSAAQMHDWLKEKYSNFPEVPPRTVFNFVMWVRQNHNLPKTEVYTREFEEVIDLPAGLQAQVDFGQSTLRATDGRRQKIYFFTMVLSMSRLKYVWLQKEPFTAHTAILAHEKAFAFFEGIPRQLVYDQDAVFLADENLGDLVLVATFRRYVDSRPFKTYFCRKEDPQSKGKIENVVGYVKHNFLFNRAFTTIETLNEQALAWLNRTGNGQVHQKTHRIPKLVWKEEERQHLLPYIPIAPLVEPLKGHKVLKTNVLLYHGNTYSLPFGLYQGEDTRVFPREEGGMLLIYDHGNRLVATHQMPEGKGRQVFNTDHRRNRAEAMNALRERFCSSFDNQPLAEPYMNEVAGKYPRYLRDQLVAIIGVCEKAGHQDALRALKICVDNHIVGANDFKAVLCSIQADKEVKEADLTPARSPMMTQEATELVFLSPETSHIEKYEIIFNTSHS